MFVDHNSTNNSIKKIDVSVNGDILHARLIRHQLPTQWSLVTTDMDHACEGARLATWMDGCEDK